MSEVSGGLGTSEVSGGLGTSEVSGGLGMKLDTVGLPYTPGQ